MFAPKLKHALRNVETVRNLAITGRHSKIVAHKKNALDAAKTKLYARLGAKILMVS
jgi:hypothetical protein